MENKDRNLLIVGIVAVAAIIIILGLFGTGYRGYGMMGGYGGGFMLLGWILNILTIILVIAGVYWLIKKMKYNGGKTK